MKSMGNSRARSHKVLEDIDNIKNELAEDPYALVVNYKRN